MTTLIIDVRTPYQATIIQRILHSGMIEGYTRLLIVCPGKIASQIDRECISDIISYEFNPAKHAKFLHYFRLALKALKSAGSRDVDLLTAVNHGPFFAAFRGVFAGKVILFEDGISTFLKLPKRFSLFPRYKFLFAENFEFAILDVGSDALLEANILDKVRLLGRTLIEQPIPEVRDYFASSSSVEYGLEPMKEYEARVKRLREMVASRHINISFHHNETLWQEKLAIFEKEFDNVDVIDRNQPLEAALKSTRIGTFIAPYNTSAMNIVRYFDCEKLVLFDDNGPNMQARIELFRRIKIDQPIVHIPKDN